MKEEVVAELKRVASPNTQVMAVRMGDSCTRVWFTGKDGKRTGSKNTEGMSKDNHRAGEVPANLTDRLKYQSPERSAQSPHVPQRPRKMAESKMRDLLCTFIMGDFSSQLVPWKTW